MPAIRPDCLAAKKAFDPAQNWSILPLTPQRAMERDLHKTSQRTRTVVHYTGHRMASGVVRTSLHPEHETRVARAIRIVLEPLEVMAAFGSLAAGSDILFAEALLERGVPIHLFFPCQLATFRSLSVRPSGAAWITRFRRARAKASAIQILAGLGLGHAHDGYAVCSRRAMDSALEAAARTDAALLQLAVWDGHPPAGLNGTAADVQAWRDCGLATAVIDPCGTILP